MTTPFPRIRKVVFPVAGMGTRFLPATKANPKEMLPIVDKPLIQYAVEEAIEAANAALKTILTKPTSWKTSWHCAIKKPCSPKCKTFCPPT